MAFSGSGPIVFHADQEHGGIRALVVVLLFFLTWILYAAISALLQTLAPAVLLDYVTFIACVSAVPVALVVVYFTERGLKRWWPSGRRLMMDEGGIQAATPEGEAMAIHWAGNVIGLYWYFHLSGYPRGGRERRVPGKWLCLACQVQQEDRRLIVYTYMPPHRAAPLLEADDGRQKFHQILPVQVYDTSMKARLGPPARPEIPTRLINSKDGRYWLAERRRWNDGFELAPSDFKRFIEQLEGYQHAIGRV